MTDYRYLHEHQMKVTRGMSKSDTRLRDLLQSLEPFIKAAELTTEQLPLVPGDFDLGGYSKLTLGDMRIFLNAIRRYRNV